MEGLAEVRDTTNKFCVRDLALALLAPRSPTTHCGNEIAARARLALRKPRGKKRRTPSLGARGS